MNNSTVFVRTNQGQQASRDPNAPLPRALKTLLIMIDGKTSVETYSRLLPNFGDVGALLDALLASGYIAEAEPPAHTAASRPAAAYPVPPRQNAPAAPARAQPSDSRQFAPTQAMPTERASRLRESASLSRHNSTLGDGGGEFHDPYRRPIDNRLSASFSAVSEDSRVREARSLMTDFLYVNLPDIATQAVLALERLETTEQLLHNLGDYERVISRTGRRAAEHLHQIRATLGR
jgi:hypothetical protein